MSLELERDQKWMRQALAAAALALDARPADVPVGAVIVGGEKLLVSACNKKEQWQDPTAHAEIVAIRELAKMQGNWRLDGLTLYTTLEPCPMCAEAILQSRIGKVVFGAYDPLSGALGSAFNLYGAKRIYPVPEVIGGILEQECGDILKSLFRDRG
jgi:tRNA(adenine34) deaminase